MAIRESPTKRQRNISDRFADTAAAPDPNRKVTKYLRAILTPLAPAAAPRGIIG